MSVLGPPHLTLAEVASRLRLDVRTVRSICDRGHGPPRIKVGRQWRFPAERFEAWEREMASADAPTL